MAATYSNDFTFIPKVWSDHAMAYFDKKLVYGAFALRNDSLTQEGTGVTINFPYYTAIGEAEEPAEDESLTIDNLTDNSFSATIFEVGKAVGIKKKAFKTSADMESGIIEETQAQIARVHAEKVDEKLNDEITTYNGMFGGPVGPVGDLANQSGANTYANMLIGYQAQAAGDTLNIRNLLQAKTRVFGDKAKEAVVCFLHPLQLLDLKIDQVAGFLRADANDPMSAINGFLGTLHNMAIVEVESVKKLPNQIDGRDAYLGHFHKMNSYGIINKQEMEMDDDYDILSRQYVFTGNQWYGVKSFDRKIHRDDTKAGGIITTVEFSLVA